jgi:hypothetical protein
MGTGGNGPDTLPIGDIEDEHDQPVPTVSRSRLRALVKRRAEKKK